MTNVLAASETAAPVTLTPRSLRCRLCGTAVAAAPVAVCSECLGPLEAVPVERDRIPSRDEIARRDRSMWRYLEWLPFDGVPALSLDTGFTPLVDAPRLASRLGVGRCWIKNDAVRTRRYRSRIGSSRAR